MIEPRLIAAGTNALGLPSYTVFWRGKPIGSVGAYYPTIEREIPGKQYVAWRRKSRTRHWIAEYPGCLNPYRCPHRTRRAAVDEVVKAHAHLLENDDAASK